MNYHRRIAWCLAGVTSKAQKELRISVLSDMLNGFLLAQAKTLLDE
jgi:hypothetical protein